MRDADGEDDADIAGWLEKRVASRSGRPGWRWRYCVLDAVEGVLTYAEREDAPERGRCVLTPASVLRPTRTGFELSLVADGRGAAAGRRAPRREDGAAKTAPPRP